jgi:hypothetical protein
MKTLNNRVDAPCPVFNTAVGAEAERTNETAFSLEVRLLRDGQWR